MWYFLLLLMGFVPLIFGANLLVDNASSLAKKLNIPNIVIGLTIVAFGTSAPELTVNLFASFKHSSDLAIGNIIGSNIFNTLVILGASAIVYPFTLRKNTTWVEIPLCLLSAFALFVLANDHLIDKDGSSVLNRTDGIVLLLFFVIFLVYNFRLIGSGKFSEEIMVKERPALLSVVLLIAGLILLIMGGRLIVISAVRVATLMGMSERIIGLTVVSVGTSLPELATSIMAARKKNTDIVIGNILGSNIMNIFFVLGASACIFPIPVQPEVNIDLSVNLGAGILLFIFIFTGKGRKIERWEGILFVISYLLYIGFLIIK
jgi:cation:H+ antiporter